MGRCPWCGRGRIVKNGSRRGQQQYRCNAKECSAQFAHRDLPFYGRFDAQVIARSIELELAGLSYREIASRVQQECSISDTNISRSTILRWAERNVSAAVEATLALTATTSGIWSVEWAHLPQSQASCWSVVDLDSHYVMAARIGVSDPARTATEVVRRARTSTNGGGYSFTLRTDAVEGDLKAIPEITGKLLCEFPPEAYVAPEDAPALPVPVFGCQGYFSHTIEKMLDGRSFRSLASRQRFLDGCVISHNFFTPRYVLGWKTPAQLAGAELPFASWLDVVNHVAVLREIQRRRDMGF